jgi:hypothetical protein
MTESEQPTEQPFFRRWLLSSFLGWLLGFVLIMAISVVWNMIGGTAQFMIGLGMGAGVGFMQGRVAIQWVGSVSAWTWATFLGLSAPFVLGDIGRALGLGIGYSLPIYMLISGLLAGLLQRRLLSGRFEGANWWVLASLLGGAFPRD